MSTDVHTRHDARHTVRSVSLGTLWRLLRYPFVLLSAIVVPRLMGDAVYGRYAFFMNVYLILDILTDIGITQAFGRFLPELESRGEPTAPLLRGLLRVGLAVTLAVIAAIVLPLALLGGADLDFGAAGWVALGLLLVLTKTEGTCFAFLYGRNEIGRYSAKELIRSAATFAFVVAMYAAWGLPGALWALVLNEAVLLGFALLWTHRELRAPGARLPFTSLWPYVAFGVRFYVPVLLFGLLQRAGVVFIRGLSGSYEEAGYFDVANQLLLLTTTFLGLIVATLLPAMSALHARGERATIVRWHAQTLAWCGAVIVLTFHALALLGPHVIRLCLGEAFAPVYHVALVLLGAMAPGLLAYVGMNHCLLEQQPGVYLRAVGVSVAVMAAGCLALVPAAGAVGAAWATLAGYGALALALYARYRGDLRPVVQSLGAVLAAGLPLALLWWLCPGPVAAAALFAVSALAYALALVRFRLVSLADARDVLASLRGGRAPASRPVVD